MPLHFTKLLFPILGSPIIRRILDYRKFKKHEPVHFRRPKPLAYRLPILLDYEFVLPSPTDFLQWMLQVF